MRLLVVSHTPHYRTDEGLAGWGPTVRELDHLASLFKRVVHVAPVHAHEGSAPASSRIYRAPNLRVQPLAPSGGPGLAAKLGILGGAPTFWATLLDEITRSDVVHVRAPANVALLALLVRRLAPSLPWWAKYAGNWRPEGEAAQREALSYRLQRAMLRRPAKNMAVTVNGRFDGDGPHIRPFLNPSLDDEDLRRAREAGEKELDSSLRLLFVGRLDEAKGAARALEVAAELGASSLENVSSVAIDIAGDGPLRGELDRQAQELGVEARFHGWLPRPALDELYRRAHFIVLPSLASEGWPKVLSEAMAWGVVPVASDISAIPGILGELGVGAAVPARDISAARDAILDILTREGGFAAESRRAGDAAERFSYRCYLEAVRVLFASRFGLEIGKITRHRREAP